MEYETPPLKKRDHKWMWDEKRPGTNWAQCKHCGTYKQLVNKWGPDDQPA